MVQHSMMNDQELRNYGLIMITGNRRAFEMKMDRWLQHRRIILSGDSIYLPK